MQELVHSNWRPAKALVLVASVAALVAPTALGAPGDRGPLRTDGHTSTVAPVGRGAQTPSVTIVEPSAFDWADAGVGAAGALGLILLAGGATIASRHTT
jgi:hypothetical protein